MSERNINEVLDLMQRMEELPGGYTGLVNEDNTSKYDNILFIPKLKSSICLIEALNLGRIEKHGADGFVILSANRSDVESSNQNNDLTKEYFEWLQNNGAEDNHESKNKFLRKWNLIHDKELLKDILTKGYTYSTVYGGYKGSDDVIDSLEPSFVVYNHKKSSDVSDWNELYDFAIEMCRKYYQDSVYIQAPNEAPNYIDANGNKVNASSTKNMKFNRDNEIAYTTTKRDKNNPQRFTANMVFEGKYYRPSSRHEYVDRIQRTQYGEIFLG